MIVQIYEIQTPGEAQIMIDLGVDHIGSVIQDDFQWKNPELKETVALIQKAGHKSSLIPLFTDVDLITQAMEYYQPDMLHFCETLPYTDARKDQLAVIMERQKEIRRRFRQLQIMRSIPIVIAGARVQVSSLDLARYFEAISDWFLTDTLLVKSDDDQDKYQPVDGYVGITGKTCDWTIARQLVLNSSIPVILAGGIGPQNVREAIAQVHPAGIDSCTQTNDVDENNQPVRFRKDPDKVKVLVTAAKLAGRELKNNNQK